VSDSACASPYEPGDLVMVRNPQRTKMSAQYRGPYTVVQTRDPDFKVRMSGREKWLHGKNLKGFLKRGEEVINMGIEENAVTSVDDVAVVPSESDADIVLSENGAMLEQNESGVDNSELDHFEQLECMMNAESGSESDQELSESAVTKSEPFGFLPKKTSSGRVVTRNKKFD